MTAADDILKKVRQWTSLAQDDLLVAEQTLTMPEPRPYRIAAYLAQQCAEKTIKAYLVSRSFEFPFTHHLGVLLDLCRDQPHWQSELRDVDELTPYATSARYPTDEEPVTPDEARRAIQIATRVQQTVAASLL